MPKAIAWAPRLSGKILLSRNNRELLAQANARIKVALDNVTTNVMVADREFNIVYVNQSVQAMLRKAATDLRKDLPDFDRRKFDG